jgi:hypothetical protein
VTERQGRGSIFGPFNRSRVSHTVPLSRSYLF